MKFHGLKGLTIDQVNAELANGAKFVVFTYALSFIIFSVRNSSPIYFIRKGQSTWRRSFQYTMISLLFGWWGIPWGPIFTVMSIYRNLRGGRDVTPYLAKAFSPGGVESLQSLENMDISALDKKF